MEKRKTISLKYSKLVLMISLICLLMLNNRNAYAADFSEQEVKQQIQEYIQNSKLEAEDMFKIVEYDLDELVHLEETGFILNDYRENHDMDTLIVEGTIETFLLPFNNGNHENAYAIFQYEDGTLEWSESAMSGDFTYEMKLKEGRFDGIDLSKVETVHYCVNEIYALKFDYIVMKDGAEFIIPFQSKNQTRLNSLEYGRVYTIQEFFDTMDRYYQEPTMEELMKQDQIRGEDEPLLGGIFLRETPLKKTEKESLPMKYWYGGFGGLVLTVVLILLVKKNRILGKN